MKSLRFLSADLAVVLQHQSSFVAEELVLLHHIFCGYHVRFFFFAFCFLLSSNKFIGGCSCLSFVKRIVLLLLYFSFSRPVCSVPTASSSSCNWRTRRRAVTSRSRMNACGRRVDWRRCCCNRTRFSAGGCLPRSAAAPASACRLCNSLWFESKPSPLFACRAGQVIHLGV